MTRSDSTNRENDVPRPSPPRDPSETAPMPPGTIQHQALKADALEATREYQGPLVGKLERDVSFAAALVASGSLSTRKLAGAVQDWTIHGDVPLATHLLSRRYISQRTAELVEKQAVERLTRAGHGNEQATTSPGVGDVLARLDSNGSLCKLLGLHISRNAEPGHDARTVATRFKLLRRLGQGGMGTVWLARDDVLGRLVAIKDMRQGVGDPDVMRARFRREAQVTGRLEHPSIVPVHQLSEDANADGAFYVMRFLGKRTLDDAIAEYHERREAGDNNPMHLHHLLTAFVTVCQALAYAHSRHVVHRDLKPENIALDDFGQVIVLDWGLAKLTGRGEFHELFSDLETAQLPAEGSTSAGQVLGSPMYMAPEQAAGRNDEIEQSTDIYGLGAILFAILTGVAPHEKSHEALSSTSRVAEMLQSIVSGPAPRAKLVSPDVPPELDAVCAKAMAQKRYARYGHAVELAEDVQRWMAGERVSAYQEPWQKRFQRWVLAHRRTAQVASILATIIVVTAITLGVTSYHQRASQHQARFESLKADAQELAVGVRGLAGDLVKNVRFMATLPPVQAIIDARAGTATDTEDVWRGRLEVIYRGLLEANPHYLAASYSSMDASSRGADEIARVERRSAGSFVRVLPKSRLSPLAAGPLLERITACKPGDVAVDDLPLAHENSVLDTTDGHTLTAGIPVYDETSGEIFGVVAVQMALQKSLRELLTDFVGPGEHVYIADRSGVVFEHYSRGSDLPRSLRDTQVASLIRGSASLFQRENGESYFTDGVSAYGQRIALDPRDSQAMIAVVLQLEE